MGRPDIIPGDYGLEYRFFVLRLSWEDGDYDPRGAYWGGGSGDHIYWFEAPATETTEQVRMFVRAKTFNDAKNEVLETFPKARFYAN